MNFLPHGYCFAWTQGLLWPMVAADTLIAAAYFSIPIAIVRVMRRRGDSLLGWIPWLFSGFIFACGITHVMDVWTIWQPYYRLQTLAKIVTAVLSVTTAVALWRLIPAMSTVPSLKQLQTAEDDLVNTQQSLSVTLSSFGAGFLATDRQGHVTHMNAVAEQMTGWSLAEARGQRYWDVVVRADRPLEYLGANPVEIMMEQGVTVASIYHVDVIARDGRRTAVEMKGDLTRDAHAQVRGSVMVLRDMSRLLRAEGDANRLAAIVESSSDAIVGTDLDGTITTWNEAAHGMFGYLSEEAIGRSVLMLVPPERRREAQDTMQKLAAGNRVPTFDTAALAMDGGARQISVTLSAIRDARGAVVGISRIIRDVSQQRRAEAALRDSEAKLRFTMEAAQIGEWDLDLKTGIAHQSALHAQRFGYAECVPGWSFDKFMEHVHPDDRAELQKLLGPRARQPGSWHFECRIFWPDGSLHWIRVHGSSLCENGTPVRMLGIVTDITQDKLAEASRLTMLRLESENREIQEASRLKSLFLANMSHELRTPLNAIIGFSDLLYSGAVRPEAPKHREFIGHIAASGRHLLELIDGILDLSKVESGKLKFSPQRVHLPTVIHDVKESLRPAIERKSLTVSDDLDAALDGALSLDTARLQQVLYNYLSNAVKFSRDGGRIAIRARPEGPDHFRIEVEDDGIGIAEADVPRLFHEFQQLDGGLSKQHQGTGMGLALTRRLVEAQGGRVGMHSVLGQGSTFHFILNRIHGTDRLSS